AMGVRYGLDNDRAQGLRGVTIVPARVSGLGERVGSLEVGKDADILVVTGDPIDPRTAVEATWIDGELFYDARSGRRMW
ncbi:MAG: amidohydrolase family protein, partial [Planctomycetota bacterium]